MVLEDAKSFWRVVREGSPEEVTSEMSPQVREKESAMEEPGEGILGIKNSKGKEKLETG